MITGIHIRAAAVHKYEARHKNYRLHKTGEGLIQLLIHAQTRARSYLICMHRGYKVIIRLILRQYYGQERLQPNTHIYYL